MDGIKTHQHGNFIDQPVYKPIAQSHASSVTRLIYLDTIRGLAALSVICSHYVYAYGIPSAENLWRYTPLHIWFDGDAAVSLFFVLSGFVLSMKYLHPNKDGIIPDIHYAGYVVSRICRIWIPFLTVLLLSAGMQRIMPPIPAGSLIHSDWAATFWTVSSDLDSLINQAVFNRQNLTMHLIPQDWTLRFELVLSLVIPVAVLLARHSTLWLIGVTFYAIVIWHVSSFALHFMMGVILAKHYYHIMNWFECRDRLRLILLIVGLLLYTFRFTIPHYMQWGGAGYIRIITGIGSAFLLAFVFVSPKTQRVLLHPAAHYIGRISYSVYLSHMIILLAITPLLLAILPDSLSGHWLIGLIATIGFTAALSSILYKFVEMPSITMGQKCSAVLKALP